MDGGPGGPGRSYTSGEKYTEHHFTPIVRAGCTDIGKSYEVNKENVGIHSCHLLSQLVHSGCHSTN